MRAQWIVTALAALALLAGCGGVGKNQGPANNQTPAGTYQLPQKPAAPAGKKEWTKPPAMKIDPNKQYFATIKTSLGDIRVELFAKDAPKTVNNFVFLAREGFYDGVIFHRVIPNFMIQGGDPTGTGAGGPGYRFQDELPPKRSYDPGIVAMANAGPNTNGSQFFICNGPNCKNLDQIPNYTQFGKVVAGMDVVQKISSVETVMSAGGERSKPKNPPVIQTVAIEEK